MLVHKGRAIRIRALKERSSSLASDFAAVSQVVSAYRARLARKHSLGGVDDQQFKQKFDLYATAIWSFKPTSINIEFGAVQFQLYINIFSTVQARELYLKGFMIIDSKMKLIIMLRLLSYE